MFPGLDVDDLLIPTCQVKRVNLFLKTRTPDSGATIILAHTYARSQRTRIDLVQTGEDADIEKDFCLERYVAFAKRLPTG